MEAPPAPPPAPPTLQGGRLAFGGLAVVLWATSVFEHEQGGQLFARLFNFGRDHFGPHGRWWTEVGILGAALLIAATVVGITAWKVLRSPQGRRAAPELGARWAAWFLFALAANRFSICLQSEDVHFAQYGFVAFAFAFASGRPRLAFLLATFLGFLDESNQWWRMYFDTCDNHLDWNDMILNACGAAAGALPFTSLLRIERYASGTEDSREPRSSPRVVAVGLAALTGLLAFLVLKTDLGHYPRWPFWTELDNKKPFHILTLQEGIPALLSLVFTLYYVVDERRRSLPFRALVVGLLALHLGVTPPRSDRDEVVHEAVPTARVPHAPGKVTVDGRLDPAEWAGAAALELHGFAPGATEEQRKGQAAVYGAELATRALLQWDERALYVGFECESADVWARKTGRDDPALPNDSVVEVFLDTDASEQTYYEFEVSPANVVQDLFVYWPSPPGWRPNPMHTNFVGLNRWDSRALETAVTVQGGECELLDAGSTAGEARRLSPTRGWTAELAIPWADLRGRHVPPTAGARLRANLYRIEHVRPRGSRPDTFLAWSPTRAPLDFHRPSFFGVLELEGPAPDKK